MSVFSEIDSKFIWIPVSGLLLALDYDAVKSSIDNILRTNKGERVMLPAFGSDLTGVLWETIDDTVADLLSDQIKDAITTWDPRVTINSIVLTPDYDNHLMKVSLAFQIVGIVSPYTYEGVLQQ